MVDYPPDRIAGPRLLPTPEAVVFEGEFNFSGKVNLGVVHGRGIGQQISDYLATSPVISNRTLFVVWGGSNDLLGATSIGDVLKAAANLTNDIQRLIDAGATRFVIPNQPPLGLTPALNGNLKNKLTANAGRLTPRSVLLPVVKLIYGRG